MRYSRKIDVSDHAVSRYLERFGDKTREKARAYLAQAVRNGRRLHMSARKRLRQLLKYSGAPATHLRYGRMVVVVGGPAESCERNPPRVLTCYPYEQSRFDRRCA
jgi:hypothetical protein